MKELNRSRISSLLIANRGEIASRIIRTCRKMGIKSVAVFSDADRNSVFVQQADEAIYIGENPPAQSYLDAEKIIAAAKRVQADAIHPGYGFLSENAEFAKACAKAGLVFIGPNPTAIASMGSKAEAKLLMEKHDVPVVPGYQGDDQSLDRLLVAAKEIGYPVLLKATAGGGGRGMRIVETAHEMEASILAAKREAKTAFGNDSLILEKYIATGRHIEFQIFGDQHGHVVHLLERECSLQRRYQKIVEESPSPVMTTALRQQMGDAAIKAAKALAYDNAGTVEFIYDDQSNAFYFLEVNTRLQVEHPVTEAITGLDLVKMQIESAMGMPLSLRQEAIKGNGYAIEVRLYAEDANNNFLPVTGKVERFEWPQVEGLRLETSIEKGSEISIFYDPMIAKLIVWDQHRTAALQKMQYVLKHLLCLGLTTNQNFLLQLLQDERMIKGAYDTRFIENDFLPTISTPSISTNAELASVALTLYIWARREGKRKLLAAIPSGWRNNFYAYQQNTFLIEDEEYVIKYRFQQNGFHVQLPEKEMQVQLISADETEIRLEIDGLQSSFKIAKGDATYFVHNESIGTQVLKHRSRFPIQEKEKVKGGFVAPMPSQVVRVLVEAGQAVKAGDPLLVLTSMKMENTIYTETTGKVEAVFVQRGQNVEADFLLLKLMPEPSGKNS